MAILDFSLSTIGQSGQKTIFIYLYTDNNVSDLSTIGYLNHFVQEGNEISTNYMALVTTRESKSGPTFTALYNIDYESGNWSLIRASGSGVGFNPETSYDGISNPAISGDWLHLGGFNVQAGNGNIILESDDGTILLETPTTGQNIGILSGGNINLTAAQNTVITGSNFSATLNTDVTIAAGTGSVALNGGTSISLTSEQILVPGLPNTTQPDVVNYDASTGQLSYAPASGGSSFDPTANYTLTGNWDWEGGTLLSNNNPSITFNSFGDIGINSNFGSIFIFAANNDVILETNNSGVTLDGAGNIVATAAASFQAAAGTFVNITSSAGNSTLQATNGDATVESTTGAANLIGTTTASVNAPIINLTSTSPLNTPFYANGVATFSGGQIISTPTAPNLAWNTVTATPQPLAVNNAYVTNDVSAQVEYTLPINCDLGDTIIIRGLTSGGWIVNQNAGQNIQVAAVSSTTGTMGSVSSQNQFDGMTLECVVPNTTFFATPTGTLTIT